jgi:NSS family neurotransmitter:Na+ symporter
MLGRVVGGSFFLMLCFAALTSTISMLEVPTSYFVDEKKYSRAKVVWSLAIGIFLLGIPSIFSQGAPGYEALNVMSFYKGQDFMSLISDFVDISMTLGGFLMCLFVTYRWKLHNMHAEIAEGSPGYMASFARRFISFNIRFTCPIALGLILTMLILDKFFGISF